MRGSRKSQALALLALAAIPPPAHGSDFSLALLWLGRGAGLLALGGLLLWMWMQAQRPA
ncbi:hypothetical protein [Lysobacter enzymogenes]|uniref:hypothetical protein n=1 Tax=Lysobacter enzymogenes TaxID=69 RepID=UPI0019D082A3|nr:hypothetical protein [Lysobacter enzymogenes]